MFKFSSIYIKNRIYHIFHGTRNEQGAIFGGFAGVYVEERIMKIQLIWVCIVSVHNTTDQGKAVNIPGKLLFFNSFK